MAAPRKYTDEQFAEAEQLVKDGASVREAANTLGIGYATLLKKIRPPDPVPGGHKPRKSTQKAQTVTDEQLASFWAKVAVAPAVPMGIWVGCDFCASHFVKTGPNSARKLVEMSHDEPALRKVLEGIYGYAQEFAWGAILLAYFGIPVAHHLAPDMIYKWLQMPLGLPPRGQVAQTHQHAPADNGFVPPPMPFAGMDLDSLMGMAQSMGIKIDLSEMMQDETIEAEPTTETATAIAPDEPATADTDSQTVTADPDAVE